MAVKIIPKTAKPISLSVEKVRTGFFAKISARTKTAGMKALPPKISEIERRLSPIKIDSTPVLISGNAVTKAIAVAAKSPELMPNFPAKAVPLCSNKNPAARIAIAPMIKTKITCKVDLPAKNL